MHRRLSFAKSSVPGHPDQRAPADCERLQLGARCKGRPGKWWYQRGWRIECGGRKCRPHIGRIRGYTVKRRANGRWRNDFFHG